MQDAKATRIWIVLMLLTIAAYVFARLGYEGQVLVAVVLAGAWIKGQLIIDHFMGLKNVRLVWRIIVSSWLLIVLVTIGGMYLSYG